MIITDEMIDAFTDYTERDLVEVLIHLRAEFGRMNARFLSLEYEEAASRDNCASEYERGIARGVRLAIAEIKAAREEP